MGGGVWILNVFIFIGVLLSNTRELIIQPTHGWKKIDIRHWKNIWHITQKFFLENSLLFLVTENRLVFEEGEGEKRWEQRLQRSLRKLYSINLFIKRSIVKHAATWKVNQWGIKYTKWAWSILKYLENCTVMESMSKEKAQWHPSKEYNMEEEGREKPDRNNLNNC